MSNSFLFTSESVSEGHPDKVADQISDAVLDAVLAQDPRARVAAETLCNTGLVVIAGEITAKAVVDFQGVARGVIKDIGYDDAEYGIDHRGCAVLVTYDEQSPDIAQGVDEGADSTWSRAPATRGSCSATPARDAGADAAADPPRAPPGRTAGAAAPRRPAARGCVPTRKSQVTVEYDGRPRRSRSTPSCSRPSTPRTSGTRNATRSGHREDHQAGPAGATGDEDITYLVNPTGRFVVGGPQGDCGLTGRKIIVDTYGGAGRTAAARSPARIRQGRSLGRLRGALRGEEHGRRGPGEPVRGAGGLCDRRRASRPA